MPIIPPAPMPIPIIPLELLELLLLELELLLLDLPFFSPFAPSCPSLVPYFIPIPSK